jgi:site-specific recombinase XerC
VFAREKGDPIPPERVTKRFSQLVESAGLRPIALHDLRHGWASLLLASGADMAVVSKMLGRSSAAFTADTYTHLLEGVGRRAAEAADALVPRTARDRSVTSHRVWVRTKAACRSTEAGRGPRRMVVRHQGLEPRTR